MKPLLVNPNTVGNGRARIPCLAACLALITAVAHAQSESPPSSTVFNIPFERVTLPNGLNVILSPNHTAPRVTVDVVPRARRTRRPSHGIRPHV